MKKWISGFGTADLLLLITVLIWGVNFTSVKYAASAMTPLAFTWIRVLLTVVAMLVVALVQQRQWPAPRDVVRLLALGVVGHGLYQIVFVMGVSRIRVADAALLMASLPLLVAIFSQIRGIERATVKGVVGMLISIGGVAAVILGSTRQNEGDGSWVGVLLILGAVTCWGIFTTLLRPLTQRVDVVQVNAITLLGGMLPLLVLTPQVLGGVQWELLSLQVWGAIFYSSVISMGVAYLGWFYGVRVLGPTRTSVYANLQPVIAILFAWVALSEIPTMWQVAGTVAIISGIVLTRS